MKTKPSLVLTSISALVLAMLSFTSFPTFAHCDSLDGPVVKAAQRALAEANVNLALVWVQKDNEAEIRAVFQKTLIVRKLNAEARDLADTYFFETLVRLHRAGEGAPYTGLKPAGRDLGPAIPAGDKALETGQLEPVQRLLSNEVEHGLHEHFKAALAKKKFRHDDVEAGRAYVKAYVAYIHYVEGVHQAAKGAAHGHPGEPGETDAHGAGPHEKQ